MILPSWAGLFGVLELTNAMVALLGPRELTQIAPDQALDVGNLPRNIPYMKAPVAGAVMEPTLSNPSGCCPEAALLSCNGM